MSENRNRLAMDNMKEEVERYLIECAKEILDMDQTGILVGGEIRRIAKNLSDNSDIDKLFVLSIVQSEVESAALRFVVDYKRMVEKFFG